MAENEKVIAVQRTAKHFFRTRRIWQYDVGHVLQFNDFDLPDVFQVHFARSTTGESTTQIGADGACALPDMYAQNSGSIYAWVYVADAETGLTKELIEIPVEARGAITNQEPTPVQQSAIDQAIAALNDAVEKTGEAQQAAEDAAESVKNASATAETLSPGSPATVVVEDVEGVKTFHFGIPEGRKGDDGEKGDAFTYADFTEQQKAELVQGPILEAQTDAVTAVNDAGAAQVKSVEEKGEEVRQSILHDITATVSETKNYLSI